MKKKFIFLFILLTCLILTGCNDNNKKSETSTVDNVYSFTDNGHDFILGKVFDEKELGESSSYSETVSCASQGTDKTYTYPHFEVKTYNDGENDRILSIYLIDDEVKTKEGIKITDSFSDMTNVYGTDYETKDTLYIYTLGKTKLEFMVENDIITSIEYVYDIEL